VSIVRNHFDSIIWLKFDYSFFQQDSDIFVSDIYIWPKNSSMYNLLRSTFSHFFRMIFLNYFSSLQEDLITENDLESDTFYNDHDLYDTSCNFFLNCPITVAEICMPLLKHVSRDVTLSLIILNAWSVLRKARFSPLFYFLYF
jgi:hypothetical protein